MRRQEIASLVFSSSDFLLRPYLIYGSRAFPYGLVHKTRGVFHKIRLTYDCPLETLSYFCRVIRHMTTDREQLDRNKCRLFA